MSQRNYALECAKYYWHGESVQESRTYEEVFEHLRMRGFGTTVDEPASMTGIIDGWLARLVGYKDYRAGSVRISSASSRQENLLVEKGYSLENCKHGIRRAHLLYDQTMR